MIIFDTEDDSAELLAAGKSGFDKRITQIAAVSDKGKKFINRGNPLEFLKFCHQCGDDDIWGFNISYDIGNLCHAGKINLDDFDQTLVKGRFIRAKIEGLNFRDVRNLSGAGSSVASLGLACGLPKFGAVYSAKEMENFTPRRIAEARKFEGMGKAELFKNPEYVLRDCVIPLRWLEFVKEKCAGLGLKNIPATLGGLCVNAYHAGGGQNWFDAGEVSQSALHGARVEIFSGGGKGCLAYTDINSLYPSAMTENFPTHLEPLPDFNGYGIAKIDVEIPEETWLAPLPWKNEDGQLLFPTGRFSGIWILAEIRNALKHGARVKKIHWILGSKNGKPFYRDYILRMYQNRLEAGNPAENLFWKLLMNNLYGRLAIGGVVSRSLRLTDENKSGGIPYGTKILTDYKMPLPEFTNFCHAAHVLGYGRLRLFDYLKRVGRDNLVYCDTDSAIFFCDGKKIPFSVGCELGQMKLESFGSYARPVLPKMYDFDGRIKAKGVPRSQARTFFETGRATFEIPFRLREAIRFYDENNSRKLSVWRKVTKIRAAQYDRKRAAGNYFLPICLK